MNPDTIHLMLDLIKKSKTINVNDSEYNKMKQRISTINNKSLPNEIFDDDKFYVRKFNFCSFKVMDFYILLGTRYYS